MTPITPEVIFDHKFQKMKKRRKRLVVIHRTRFVIVSLIFLIVMSIIITSITGALMSEASTNIDQITYTVAQGDTLWSIANEYNYLEKDIREVVFAIKKLNHKKNSMIIAGEQLVIPVSNQ